MANSEQTPLAAFPDNIIAVPKISAPNDAQLQLILEYNQYLAAGNIPAAKAIIDAHDDLNNCRVTADNYNRIIDEIKAIEIFFRDQIDGYIDDVEDYVTTLVGQAVSIEDDEITTTSTYSSTKLERTFNLDIQSADWTQVSTNLWTFTATSSSPRYNPGQDATDQQKAAAEQARDGLDKVTSGMSPVITIRYPSADGEPIDKSRKRMLDKAFSSVYAASTGDGSITFSACEQPSGPVYLRVKGV